MRAWIRVVASQTVGCMLRVELIEFVDRLDVEGEGKRGDKDKSWIPGLGNWVNYGIISSDGGSVWWGRI